MSVAYLQRNVAPEVLSITLLPIGVGLQAMPQPPADPNIESSGLDPALFGATTQIPPVDFISEALARCNGKPRIGTATRLNIHSFIAR